MNKHFSTLGVSSQNWHDPSQRACIAVCVVHVFALAFATSPPGPGPFGSNILSQPVPGAARAILGWKSGKLCDVSSPPYSATNNSNATAALQQAIDDCGDLGGEGGTVLVKAGLILRTASLWLRSDLTLRIEVGATLLGTATGDMKSLESTGDAVKYHLLQLTYMTRML